MTVYVDQIIQWSTKIRCFKGGSCHLSADTIEELHSFAARLGLKRAWFQDHKLLPHYDLTPARRKRALELGAVFIEAREQARWRRAIRETDDPEWAATLRLAGPIDYEGIERVHGVDVKKELRQARRARREGSAT